MPLPKPSKGQKEDDWISSCMGNDKMKSEYPEEKQRLGVCYSQWENKKREDDEMAESIETRCEDAPAWEVRQEKDQNPKIVGYAAVFNSWSEDLGGFTERIEPGAFGPALKNSDVRALFNHDKNYVLGRQSAGTLRMNEDDKGLHIEISPPNTQWARDLMESIKRQDVNQQSFSFRVKTDEWSEDKDKKATRSIKEFDKIRDVSIVTFPAYRETSVAVRSLEHWKESQKQEPEPRDYGVQKKRLALRQKQL